VIEQPPIPTAQAARAVARCAATTSWLLARRRLASPTRHVGRRLAFADGTSAPVYRETIALRPPTVDPAVLVVRFRLRWLRGRGHDVFRRESPLNTVLFAGFPGFVSKLWLAHDQRECYRGLYEWDGPGLAEDYARALHPVLALVSVPTSIEYEVLPELRRDDLIADPHLLDLTAPPESSRDWWRLVPAAA
jgi:hypothetical protein